MSLVQALAAAAVYKAPCAGSWRDRLHRTVSVNAQNGMRGQLLAYSVRLCPGSFSLICLSFSQWMRIRVSKEPLELVKNLLIIVKLGVVVLKVRIYLNAPSLL